MAGTQVAFALLAAFAGDTRKTYTINQLAHCSGKAYPNVHATTNALLKERILTKTVVGHSHHCALNLSNDKTLLYLSLLQARKRDELLRNNPEERLLLAQIDSASAKEGILLAWRRPDDLLLITTLPKRLTMGMPTRCITLQEFLTDDDLRATIGAHTLLFGHALYASLLRQDRHHPEVLR